MKFWMALCSLLVGAALFAAGFLTGAGAGKKSPARDDFFPDMPPEGSLFLIKSDKVLSELEVDAAQKEKIDRLLQEHSHKVRELREGMNTLTDNLRGGVDAILSPKQKERLSQIKDQYAERELQFRATKDLNRLRRDLGDLAPEQETRIFEVYLGAQKKRREAFHATPRPGREQMWKSMKEIREEQDARIGEILTAPQKGKFLKLREEPRWGEDRHRGPPRPQREEEENPPQKK